MSVIGENTHGYSRRLSSLQVLGSWRSYRNLMNLQKDSNPRIAADAKAALHSLKVDRLSVVLSLSIYCPATVTELHCMFVVF